MRECGNLIYHNTFSHFHILTFSQYAFVVKFNFYSSCLFASASSGTSNTRNFDTNAR